MSLKSAIIILTITAVSVFIFKNFLDDLKANSAVHNPTTIKPESSPIAPYPPETYATPQWVIDIQDKIDLKKCGPENCEACDKETCLDHNDKCEVTSREFACGRACDAFIEYCIPSSAL